MRVGLLEGRGFVVNPSEAEQAASSLDLVLAGTADALLMIEGYCDFLSEEQMIEVARHLVPAFPCTMHRAARLPWLRRPCRPAGSFLSCMGVLIMNLGNRCSDVPSTRKSMCIMQFRTCICASSRHPRCDHLSTMGTALGCLHL